MRKCCLSAATACLCLQSESHYKTEAWCLYVCVCVCVSHLVLHNNQLLSWGHCTDKSQDAFLLD